MVAALAGGDAGAAAPRLLALGNEAGTGVFDASAVEDAPLRYAKATDVRGFNNSYPTAVAVQRLGAAGDGGALLLGMSSGDVLCLPSAVRDACAAAGGGGGGGASPQASPPQSSSSTPSTSPMRAGGIISKAFGAAASAASAAAAGACGPIVTFCPEGAIDADVKCTCLSFLPRRAAEQAGAPELFAAAYSDGSIIFYDMGAGRDPRADPGFGDAGEKREGGAGAGAGADDEAGSAIFSRQPSTAADLAAAAGGREEPEGAAVEGMLGGAQISGGGGGGGPAAGDAARSEHDPTISYSRNPKAAALQRWQLGKSASSSSSQQQLSFSSSFLPNNNNVVHAMEVSPDSKFIATGSRDGLVRIIRVATGRLLNGVKSYYGATLCLAWSPDSRLLLRCALLPPDANPPFPPAPSAS